MLDVNSRATRAAMILGFSLIGSVAAAQQASSIRGTVTSSEDKTPIAGARVAIQAPDRVAITDERGMFNLGGVPSGTRTITARRLGFAPGTVTVEVSRLAEATVAIHLKPFAATLPPVVVHPARMNYTGRLAGYYERLEKNSSGVFITRYQIDHENREVRVVAIGEKDRNRLLVGGEEVTP